MSRFGFGLGFNIAGMSNVGGAPPTQIFTANVANFNGSSYAHALSDMPLSGATDFHMSAWVKFNSLASDQVLIDNESLQFQFWVTSAGVLKCNGQLDSGAFTNEASIGFNTTTWTFLSAERVGSDLKLYQDGAQIGTTANIGASPVRTESRLLAIGALASNFASLRLYAQACNFCVTPNSGLVDELYNEGTIPCYDILPSKDTISLLGRFWPFENHTNFIGQELVNQAQPTTDLTGVSMVYTGTADIECEA